MTAKDFYNKRLEEDNTIGSVQLMEEYAKDIISINFCDGAPTEFEKCTVNELRTTQDKVVELIDWVNS